MYHFEKYVTTQYIDRDYDKVLKIFTKENIIAGTNILYQLINNLKNPAEKNYYFVRQGQLAWIIAYVVDSARNKK